MGLNGTSNRLFGVFFAFFLIGMVVLYATTVDYDLAPLPVAGTNSQLYAQYQDLHIMTFVGFTFLMTFLVRNGQTALSHSFMIGAFVILWYILCQGFFHNALANLPQAANWKTIKLNIMSFALADYAAVAVIISFGVLLGRLSAGQLLVVALFETILYAFQEEIIKYQLKAVDVGGSMSIHLFASTFGLACSFMIEQDDDRKKIKGHAENYKTTPTTDTIAMIGTLFLWCFWPSFNALGAATDIDNQRAVTNTILSLASSCVVAFCLQTVVFCDKFHMTMVRNATIVGGIAVGTAATMTMQPFVAIIIGAVASATSVVGFRYISPFLREKCNVHDTCGILNVHFFPGLIGGIAGIILARVAEVSGYNGSFATVFPFRVTEPRNSQEQSQFQLAACAVALAFGLFGGAFVGLLLRLSPNLNQFYTDEVEFDRQEEEADHKA